MADRPGISNDTTSRERVSRIEPGYYKRPDRFLRWKRTLALVAVVVGIAWCAWGAFDQERHYSPGPVAAAHAMWENNCDACHLPFTPIRGDTWLSSAESQKLLDAKCTACHQGPVHHSLQKGSDVAGCASCHADHHGRNASLVRMDDLHCTNCHADLNNHRAAPDGKLPELPDAVTHITRFDKDHPELRLPKEDPGKLKFSHGRHLALGMNLGANDTYPARTWEYIPEQYRDRYKPKGESDQHAIQLQCAACHQFDAPAKRADLASLPDAIFPQRSSGAYTLPIVYENHCAACHPLIYDPEKAPKISDPALVRIPEDAETIPHRLSGERMQEFLEGAYAEKLLQQDPKLLESRIPVSPLPAVESRPEFTTIGAQVQKKVHETARFLGQRCAECHELDPNPARPANAPDEAPLWLTVLPTNVPQIWMPKARFNHLPHRAISCQECHPMTDAAAHVAQGNPTSWRDDQHVFLPDRAVCVKCHAPRTETGTKGARFDCVECHAYHNLDHPYAGTGSLMQDADRRFDQTFSDFIRGIQPTDKNVIEPAPSSDSAPLPSTE